MEKKVLFRGVATALITPFRDGAIELDTFGRLLDTQKEAGVSAVVVAGTTGEAPTLTAYERDSLLSFALSRVGDVMPVIMGTGCADTQKARIHSRRAHALGAHGVLVVTPYYNRGTRQGVRTHFLSIAEDCGAPVLLYNVPARTGGDLSLSDYEVLLSHENIWGVKEAKEDAERYFALTSLYGHKGGIYTGCDAFFLPSLALGGDGVISVVSGIAPRTMCEIFRAFEAGAPALARAHFLHLAPLCRLLFQETSPAPIKEALRILGFGDGSCRLPLSPPEEALCHALAQALRDRKIS